MITTEILALAIFWCGSVATVMNHNPHPWGFLDIGISVTGYIRELVPAYVYIGHKAYCGCLSSSKLLEAPSSLL